MLRAVARLFANPKPSIQFGKKAKTHSKPEPLKAGPGPALGPEKHFKPIPKPHLSEYEIEGINLGHLDMSYTKVKSIKL
jgi:hypothetical protein